MRQSYLVINAPFRPAFTSARFSYIAPSAFHMVESEAVTYEFTQAESE